MQLWEYLLLHNSCTDTDTFIYWYIVVYRRIKLLIELFAMFVLFVHIFQESGDSLDITQYDKIYHAIYDNIEYMKRIKKDI